jgi:hypothetical protein
LKGPFQQKTLIEEIIVIDKLGESQPNSRPRYQVMSFLAGILKTRSTVTRTYFGARHNKK